MNLEKIFKEHGFESYYIGQGNLLIVMWQSGWEGSLGENTYMYIYITESLCCALEIITML